MISVLLMKLCHDFFRAAVNGQFGANEDSLLHRAVLENDRHQFFQIIERCESLIYISILEEDRH